MKNILVPISFSGTSKNALYHAHLIAQEHNATLSLLHCYSAQEYNRRYDFGALDYDKGIRKMLVNFYKEAIENLDPQPLKVLTNTGSVSDVISQISPNYELLILGRKTGFQSKSNQWFSEKMFYLTSKSLCSVLLLSSKKDAFYFSETKNIWHIQRKNTETDLIKQEFLDLKMDTSLVTSKSLKQQTFTSAFWHNIVDYTKSHDGSLLTRIAELFDDEHIDLLILVNHKKGPFERFLKDDTFQIISQFDIPFLILHPKTNDT